jgi:TonB family protein
MILAKPKTLFTPALGLSILIHGIILFSTFPKSEGLEDLTEKLGFKSSRITISSILTNQTKKIVTPKLVTPKVQKTTETKSTQSQILEPVSQQRSEVKSFDEAIIKNTPPTYPRIARKRGWQGEVELLMHITPNGIVKTIDVLSSTAHIILTKSAVESAKSWLFSPSSNQLPYQVKKVIKYQLK